MSDAFDPYFKWLGIPKADQPPHGYRLLGIELFESDGDVISNAADGRMAQVKNFQSGKFAAVSQKLLNEIAAAKVCLLNPQKKAEYDRHLRVYLQQKRAAANATVEEPAIAAAGSVAGLPFLDYSTTPKRSTPRPAKGAKQPAWLIPAGIGLGAIAIVTAVFTYFIAGDAKDKSASPQSASLAGGDHQTQPNHSAKSSDKPAAGKDKTNPKPTGIASTATTEKTQVPASLSSADSAPSTPKPETTPKPKIPWVAEPEKTPAPEKAPEKSPQIVADNSAPVPRPVTEKPSPEKKPPIPDKEEFQAMKSKILKIFTKEFAEAKTPESKLALAVKLNEQGDASKDLVERYALWRIAADGASVAGEFSTAMEIVDKIQTQFDVDGDAMKADILGTGAARTMLTPEAARNLCETTLKLAGAATAREDWDAGAQFSKLATAAARRAKDPQFSRDVMARGHEIEHLKTRYAVVAKALETLAADPENAEANLAVGQWHCFAKGDWEKGLPCLAKGSREDLAALAKQELAKPAGAKDQVAVADAWWALAEKDHSESKLKFQARAVFWYEQAAPGLSGLEKTRVDKQIAATKQDPAKSVATERPPHTGHGGSVQRGNVALAINGTTVEGAVRGEALIDGDVTVLGPGKGGFAYQAHPVPCEWTITFNRPYRLKQIRMLLWNGDDRFFRYAIKVSGDGRNYVPLVDRSQGEWRGWQVLDFPPRAVKAVQLIGLYGSKGAELLVVEFEAYCIPPTKNPGQK